MFAHKYWILKLMQSHHSSDKVWSGTQSVKECPCYELKYILRPMLHKFDFKFWSKISSMLVSSSASAPATATATLKDFGLIGYFLDNVQM